ncbi:hypothetical protein [Pseudomonas rhodesiae]|uniref:hypothetical protein n=1 Tax=Pseudomonas rhodesiae TaxID=76760 RepID=UPI0032B30E2B
MQHKLSNAMRPLLLNAALWLSGVALLFLIKDVIEEVSGPIGGTWIDLTLVLTAYLLFFILDPLQSRVNRHLRKRARRRQAHLEAGSRA